MNILFIKHFFVGFMVSEIQKVSVFGYCPYSVTFPYKEMLKGDVIHTIHINVKPTFFKTPTLKIYIFLLI